MAKVKFDNSKNQFFQSLKSSVEEYFRKNKIKKTGNWKLYIKTIILVPAAIMLYISLLVFSMPAAVAILLCAVLGFVIASIGFNVMHDACHGSYSENKSINQVFSLTMNALGGNAFFWKQKHNIIHHTYTNIDGVDDDIAQTKLLRQCDTQEWWPIHRYQHIYLSLAYALTLFMWVSWGDFKKYFRGRIQQTPLQPMSTKEHIIFWLSKVLYVVFYILIPILVVGPIPWLIGYVTMGMVCGLMLSYTFQLAHAVEGPEFDAIGIDDKLIETEWAIHQVKTTANFSPRNKVLSWLLGGLNYQIEHHLFPRISHVHYPAISKIVQEICRKSNLPYHCFPSLRLALISHVRLMKELGKRPSLVDRRTH